ncbi:Protein MIS12 [Glycine max]|nr:Protein MIS12 [Glycine max]
MEGSESEAVFGALYLNPQLFCNEVLNIIDDGRIEEAQHRKHPKVPASEKRVLIAFGREFNLFWTKSLLLGRVTSFVTVLLFPKDDANENAPDSGAPFDPDIDAQLDSLREKLIEVGKESEMLNQEIQALERKSIVNAAGHINEAVQLYEQNSMHEVFQEIVTTASELGTKMGKLNSSMIEETDQTKTKRIYSTQMDPSAINPVKGLSNMKLDDVEEFCKCYEEYVNLSISSI